ncbi:hypothetical protein P3L10_002081 [Capsicum annuum]
MTCSECHAKGHNKRGCPMKRSGDDVATPKAASATESSCSKNGKGRPKKQTNTDEEPAAKRWRERPRKAPVSSIGIDFATSSNYRGRATHAEPVLSVGTDYATPPNYRGKATHAEPVLCVGIKFATPPNYRGRATHAKPSTTPEIPPYNAGVSSRTRSGRGRSRGSGYPLESWFTCSQGSKTHDASNFPPREIVVAARGRQKMVGNTSQYKRPRMTGMGVFQAENGFTTISPGLPSRRIVSTGPKQVMKSAVVSGDIGFKPSSGLKWKDKQAITKSRLQQIKDQSRPSNNATMHISSSSQLRDPWKL